MVMLKEGRERGILNRLHPWVFRPAVERWEGEEGSLQPVCGAGGSTCAWGFPSRKSRIAVRLVSFGPEPPEADWLEARIREAARLRRSLKLKGNAFRLVNAEGDGLPGLIVDVYGTTTAVRPLIRGMEAAMERISAILQELFPGNAVFLKRDERAARVEELELPAGYIAGAGDGTARIEEEGLELEVDIARGQKTGFYLDQRGNRRLAESLAQGRRVLNLFAYTGSFSLFAARGGAREVVSVESSEAAVELAGVNSSLNPGLPPCSMRHLEGDVFTFLEDPEAGRFDLIVCDPPPFARRISELPGALKGYRSLNRLAFEHLEPGGLLFTFSCSQAVSMDLFKQVLMEAAKQAGREVQVLEGLHASSDHPFALYHPEGDYLKGWLLHVR